MPKKSSGKMKDVLAAVSMRESERGQQFDMAITYEKDGERHSGTALIWVPKSQIQWRDENLRMPKWLIEAKEKEVAEAKNYEAVGIKLLRDDDDEGEED